MNVYEVRLELRRVEPVPGDETPEELEEYEEWEEKITRVLVSAGLADEVEFVDFTVIQEQRG